MPRHMIAIPVVGELPSATGLTNGYPVFFDGVLHYVLDGDWLEYGGGASFPEIEGEPVGSVLMVGAEGLEWGFAGGGVNEEGVLEFPDLDVHPNPPAEGGLLYVFEGDLHYRGAGGTITMIAEA